MIMRVNDDNDNDLLSEVEDLVSLPRGWLSNHLTESKLDVLRIKTYFFLVFFSVFHVFYGLLLCKCQALWQHLKPNAGIMEIEQKCTQCWQWKSKHQ